MFKNFPSYFGICIFFQQIFVKSSYWILGKEQVAACPVADVQGFLTNPLRCYFGSAEGGGNPFKFYTEIFADTTFLSSFISDNLVKVVVDLVMALLPCKFRACPSRWL